MMRNIPSDCTREQLLEVIDAAGFRKDYDAVSLPFDILKEVCSGYAFVNFTTHKRAEQFKVHFHGFQDWQAPCDKMCETSWSDSMKGYDAFVERFRNSPVMHESVADKCKPALYKGGVRLPFPEPTKILKPPRLRRRERAGACKVGSEANKSLEAQDPESLRGTDVGTEDERTGDKDTADERTGEHRFA
jgi:hypothetical protein